MREIKIEAASIGLIGGALGQALGAIVVYAANEFETIVRERSVPGSHAAHRSGGAGVCDCSRRARRSCARLERRPAKAGPAAQVRIGVRVTAFLEANHLHKTYRLGRQNHVRALRSVDIAIEAGEMVGIMGPSGCGKSTLMHILGLMHSPDVDNDPPARLVINGVDCLTGLLDGERTRMRAISDGIRTSRASTSFQCLAPSRTSPCRPNTRAAAASEARKAAATELEWVGLADRSRPPLKEAFGRPAAAAMPSSERF